MDREQGEALTRRMREEAAASEGSQDSSEDDEGSATVRTGATRAMDADDLSTIRREQDPTQDHASGRFQADVAGGFNPDALERAPDLPEVSNMSSVGPDGSSVDQGLTDPLGGDLPGNSIAGGIRGRAAALGGDALGRGVDFEVGSRGSNRDMGRAISNRDGSQVSEVVQGDPIYFDLSEDDSEVVQGDPIYFDLSEDDSEVVQGDPIYFDLSEDDSEVVQGDEVVIPADVDDPIVGPGYAQPDPTGSDDVVTGEAAAGAVRAHALAGDPSIIRPTDEASLTGYATNLADNDPDNITNYGPEGPQSEAVANWAPPPDLLFDPPPEGASAGMAGAQAAMADPAAALGDSSMIGSSTLETPPDPPPTGPGDDPDQGPLGSPGGDSEG